MTRQHIGLTAYARVLELEALEQRSLLTPVQNAVSRVFTGVAFGIVVTVTTGGFRICLKADGLPPK